MPPLARRPAVMPPLARRPAAGWRAVPSKRVLAPQRRCARGGDGQFASCYFFKRRNLSSPAMSAKSWGRPAARLLRSMLPR